MSGGWTNGVEHPREELQDLLDGRAAPDLAARVRAHIEACPDCAGQWRMLEGARRVAATLRVDQPLPPDLRAVIVQAIDAGESGTGSRPWPDTARVAPSPSRAWRWWTAGAAAALVVLAVYVWRPAPAALPSLAARDFAALVSGQGVALELRSNDAAAIDTFFATGPGATAVPRVRVIDLGMMGFVLDGARRHILDGKPSALYAYRGPNDERIVCQMFEGRLDALPSTSDVRESGGFRFHVYHEGDVSLVFWQEGSILCVLASRMPVEDLVQLAFAKAMQPG